MTIATNIHFQYYRMM